MRNRGYIKTLAVVAAALLITSTVIYFSLQPAIGRPREANRMRHPAGFSIIRPDNWDSDIYYLDAQGAGNALYTGDPKSGRAASYIRFEQLAQAPTPEELQKLEYAPSEFQGQPAWRFEKPIKREFHVRYRFERNGKWYQLALSRPLLPPLSEFMPFLESAKVEASQATPPATTPKSLPSLPPTTAPTSG